MINIQQFKGDIESRELTQWSNYPWWPLWRQSVVTQYTTLWVKILYVSHWLCTIAGDDLFSWRFFFWLLQSCCASAVSQFMIPIFAAAKDNLARAHAASVGADRLAPDENNPLTHNEWLAPDIYVTMSFWSAMKGDKKLAYFRFASSVELHLAIIGETTTWTSFPFVIWGWCFVSARTNDQ